MPEQRAFEQVAWPVELATVRGQLQKHADDPGRRGDGPRELMATTASLGDERTIVMPIVRVSMRRNGRSRDRFLGDVRLRGYTVVGLNLDDLVATRLPALVEEHFPDSADYRIAIVSRDGDRVVFESEPGAAAATTDAPDLTATLLPAARRPDDGLRPGRGQRARRRDAGRGHAALRRRHRALPSAPPRRSSTCSRCAIATATAPCARGRCNIRTATGRCASSTAPDRSRPPWRGSRRRNLALSGGVLALLGVAVALIAVSARRAQALARQQMEFVAAVSHELRTPVAVIHSAAGNLADGVVGDPPRVKRYGATIQTEARRLGETVERVLQLAGLGSGRPLPMAPLSAADVVHDAVQHTALDAERAGVTVELEIASELAVAGWRRAVAAVGGPQPRRQRRQVRGPRPLGPGAGIAGRHAVAA